MPQNAIAKQPARQKRLQTSAPLKPQGPRHSLRTTTLAILRLARHVWFTNALLIGSLAVTLWTAFGKNYERLAPLLITTHLNLGLTQVSIGEWWRLFTPSLLHFSVLHAVCNFYVVYLLGGIIEMRRGRRALMVLLLCSALYSNLAQLLITDVYVFGGLSGVAFALFGYLWAVGHRHPDAAMRLPPRLVVLALWSFFACYPISWAGYPIANTVHAAGLVTGILFGILDREPAANYYHKYQAEIKAGGEPPTLSV